MPHRYAIFAITALAMLSFAMQFSMVSVALPELTRDLGAPIRWTGWVLTAFMVAQVVSMPVAGRLSERFGVRNVFIFGFALFSVASLISAAAPNITVLILGRAIQGAAGGALMPSAMGLIGEAFGQNRARPIGLMGSIVPMGGIIGPSLGGVIVDNLSWRWTFALNVPLGVVVVIVGLAFMRSGARRATGGVDLRGIVLLGLGLTALLYGLTELGQTANGPDFRVVGAAGAVTVVALALFIARQLSTPNPIVDMELLRKRELVFSNLLAFWLGVALFAVFALLPLYVQSGYGMTASESGALLTPRAIAMVGTAAVAAMLLTMTGYRKPLIIGMLLMASTLLLLSLGLEEPTLLGVSFSNFAWVTLVVTLLGISFGMTMPSLNNAALDVAPDRIPAITGLRGMFMSLGGTIGVSVILLIVSRADSAAAGLEASFVGLAVILVASTLLVPGIPEMVRGLEQHGRPTPAPAASRPADEPAATLRERE